MEEWYEKNIKRKEYINYIKNPDYKLKTYIT